ncbi:MAG: hypothetical protein AAGN35_09990 [Bacteroidota bacterium]
MANSDRIFDLIQSLNKGERRNLRIMVNREGTQNSPFFRLLDELYRLEKFDAVYLQKRLKCKPYVVQRGMKRLFEMVLMTRGHYQPERREVIGKKIADIRYLIAKRKNELALGLAEAVQASCTEEERFTELITVLELKIDLLQAWPDRREKAIEAMLHARQNQLDLDRLTQLRYRIDQIQPLSQNKNFSLQIQTALNDPLLQASFSSERARYRVDELKWQLQSKAGQYELALHSIRRMVNRLSAHAPQFEDFPTRFIDAQFTIARLHLGLGHRIAANLALQRVIALPLEDETLVARRFGEYCRMQFVLALEFGDAEVGLTAANLFENNLATYQFAFSPGQVQRLIYLATAVYIFSGQYRKADRLLARRPPKISAADPLRKYALFNRLLEVLIAIRDHDAERALQLRKAVRRQLTVLPEEHGQQLANFIVEAGKNITTDPLDNRKEWLRKYRAEVTQIPEPELSTLPFHQFLEAQIQGETVMNCIRSNGFTSANRTG